MAEFDNIIRFSTLKDMISNVKSTGGGGWDDKIGNNFTYNSQASHYLSRFYTQWSHYLTPRIRIWHEMLSFLPIGLMKFLYLITSTLEHIYENMFKLFGFFDMFSDTESFIGKFYMWMRVIGAGIFVCLMILYIVQSWIDGLGKYKEIISTALLVTFAVAIIPSALGTVGQIARDTNLNTLNYTEGVDGQSSLAITPIIMNTVDLSVLIENGFDASGLESKTGYLNNTSGVVYNNITDDNFNSQNFSGWYGASDKKVLEHYLKLGKKNKKYKGVASVFSHSLGSSDEDFDEDFLSDGDNVSIKAYKAKSSSSSSGLLSSVYPRYTFHWFALYSQQIILFLILLSMILKFLSSFVNVLVSGMIVPIVGYTSVQNIDKLKQLITQILGSLSGVFFEIAILKVGWIIIAGVETMTFSMSDGTEQSFFEGLNGFETVLTRLFIYVGVYLAISMGSSAVENWLGVSTRQNGLRQGLGAAFGIAGAGFVASKMAGAGTNAMLGKKHYNPQTHKNERTGQGIVGRTQNMVAKNKAVKNATPVVGKKQARQNVKSANLHGNNFGKKADAANAAALGGKTAPNSKEQGGQKQEQKKNKENLKNSNQSSSKEGVGSESSQGIFPKPKQFKGGLKESGEETFFPKETNVNKSSQGIFPNSKQFKGGVKEIPKDEAQNKSGTNGSNPSQAPKESSRVGGRNKSETNGSNPSQAPKESSRVGGQNKSETNGFNPSQAPKESSRAGGQNKSETNGSNPSQERRQTPNQSEEKREKIQKVGGRELKSQKSLDEINF